MCAQVNLPDTLTMFAYTSCGVPKARSASFTPACDVELKRGGSDVERDLRIVENLCGRFEEANLRLEVEPEVLVAQLLLVVRETDAREHARRPPAGRLRAPRRRGSGAT